MGHNPRRLFYHNLQYSSWSSLNEISILPLMISSFCFIFFYFSCNKLKNKQKKRKKKKWVSFNFSGFRLYFLRQHVVSPALFTSRNHLLLFKLQFQDGLLLQPPPTLCSITRRWVPPTPPSPIITVTLVPRHRLLQASISVNHGWWWIE